MWTSPLCLNVRLYLLLKYNFNYKIVQTQGLTKTKLHKHNIVRAQDPLCLYNISSMLKQYFLYVRMVLLLCPYGISSMLVRHNLHMSPLPFRYCFYDRKVLLPRSYGITCICPPYHFGIYSMTVRYFLHARWVRTYHHWNMS